MKRFVFLLSIYFVSLQNSIASTLPPGTNISSNLTIDQTWINSNPGPWLISGSNITLTFGENFTISNTNQYFQITGSNVTINGANKIITVDGLNGFNGLFDASNANASSAEIKNIGVITINFTNTGGNGGYISRTLNKATISNCYSTGLIQGNSTGGIVGDQNSGLVRNCFTTGNLGSYTGGIVGPLNSGVITNCYTTGNIFGALAGGIAGYSSSGVIQNCYTTGEIGRGSGEAGIVRNTIPDGRIENCLTTGPIWGGTTTGISASPSINSVALFTNASWNITNANTVLIGVGTIWNTSTTPYTLTLIVALPTLSISNPSATLTSNCSGVTSSPTTFGVTGSNLTSGVTVSAPTGFEVSTSSNTSYASSLSLTPSGSNTVSSTLYIRLTSTATNGVSGTITALSTGATNATATISSTILVVPTFAGSGSVPKTYTLCAEASYPISLTIDANSTMLSNGWATSSSAISVNSNGYVTAGTTSGSFTVSYTDGCAQTVSATVTVNNSNNGVTAIADGQASYKFNNTAQGPSANIYAGYNGFTYSSTTKPTNTGFYRANNQSGNSAGCPYPFYIFRCTTCETVNEVTTTTVTTATNRIWMDRDLGASRVAISSTDAQAYGDLYQWGRGADGHQSRTAASTSVVASSVTPGNNLYIINRSSPYDWVIPSNVNLWQGVNGVNNPCPSGFRVPTDAEWAAEIATWGSQNAAGAFASPLKLPLAGYRYTHTDALTYVGTSGQYWTSTVYNANYSYSIDINSSSVVKTFYGRVDARSVRCIKD